MIILTQPNISRHNPIRQSSTVYVYATAWCLAEVPDDFNLSTRAMKKDNIGFWWQVTSSFVDASKYKGRKYQGGIVQGINEQLHLSKERNIAYGIYAIAVDRKGDEFSIWEKSILK